MLLYGPYTITPGKPTTIYNLGWYPDTRAMVVLNESPYMLSVEINGVGMWGVPALTADVTSLSKQFSGSITISAVDYLQTSSQAPSYVVFIQTLSIQDSLYKSLEAGGSNGYPLTLPRLQSVGNNLTVSTVTNLQNDTSAANTTVVEATQANKSGPSLSFDNSGNASIAEPGSITPAINPTPLFRTIAGTGVQLGNGPINGTRSTEVMGALIVDGTFTLANQRITQIKGFTGANTSTVTHGMGTAPTHVTVTPVANVNCWITSVTSTTFTVNTSTGTGGWYAVAYIF